MNTRLPAAVPAPGQPRTSMDELMLAMDIVDTLRHEQSLVERELASETRDADFVARVKQIYASQGIEVSEALVRQGVEALQQDRFAYVPPPRSVSVRLAEIWVDRWRWTKRALIAGVVGVLGYGIVAVPNAWMDSREYRSFQQQYLEVSAVAHALKERQGLVSARLNSDLAEPPGLVASPVAVIAAEVQRDFPTIGAGLAGLPLDVVSKSAFARDADAARRAVTDYRNEVERHRTTLERVEDRLADAHALATGAHRYDQLARQLAGLALGEGAALQMRVMQERSAAALASGEVGSAHLALAEFERAMAQVDLAYTLRIVNRDGVQSGVWRYHEDAPGGKNYYLVVEAIDAGGQVLSLPVTNEETQRTETVSRFAIRVPQSEYDKVKADKLDNGLIDEAMVGEKRRGEFDVDYRVAVAGGAITEW
ncbi:MAG: hypothetical protein KA763_12390 [Xanthomonadales bacterium]|nr:hypothetical protein [Xanthomonadales bacterium]